MRAAIVDHSTPHRGNEALFFERSNLHAMCKSCHDRKTATRDSTFARRGAREHTADAPLGGGGRRRG
jgi:5-methylcytosine-specific restriction endonuclease McrA